MEQIQPKDAEFFKINQLYDECLSYLQTINKFNLSNEFNYVNDESINDNNCHFDEDHEELGYEVVQPKHTEESETINNDNGIYEELSNKENSMSNENIKSNHVHNNNQPEEEIKKIKNNILRIPNIDFKVENEFMNESTTSLPVETKSERLRRLSEQLPKIVITKSNSTVEVNSRETIKLGGKFQVPKQKKKPVFTHSRTPSPHRLKTGYGDFPKRLVSKNGIENVALISNVPFERLRLLNDTFHTLINLRWRWIVVGTVVVHFAIWLVFAVFWYISALAHYDFAPDPPRRSCVTGGKDFVTIFLASVEAQTTIGFGDRAIDEECPEAIFLFIMQLILGTGLSGVLTCVVYAKLTRPEKLSRDGVGFSKKAVVSMRDGRLCLMVRAWDLNYDHIIGSVFNAHFIHTYKTKEGETIRYYSQALPLQTQQFLLWPVTLVHVIDNASALYHFTPVQLANSNFEIAISLKGASASMGTFTQSQTSYTPKEIVWGYRFPPVVKYDSRKQKYVIDHKKLNATEAIDTPYCSASELNSSVEDTMESSSVRANTPSNFSDQISGFVLNRTSSFRKKDTKT